jgi:hypothetical protein
MTTPPVPPPPPGAAAGGRKRATWIVPVAVIGTVVLLVCCIGAAVVATLGGDSGNGDPDGGAPPGTTEQGTADQDSTGRDATGGRPDGEESEGEAEDPPEPAGFGAGLWEVNSEIPAGTYVTIVPDGGVFDSCYWARLSGFSGGLDDIIANDNLAAGARGRIAISSDDAGIEFSGRCRWVALSDATPVEIGDEVGAGVWAVGDEIPPGTYITDAADGGVFDSCYWARLSGFSGEFGDIIANGNIAAGSRGRVEISANDAGIEFSGDCIWSRG